LITTLDIESVPIMFMHAEDSVINKIFQKII